MTKDHSMTRHEFHEYQAFKQDKTHFVYDSHECNHTLETISHFTYVRFNPKVLSFLNFDLKWF